MKKKFTSRHKSSHNSRHFFIEMRGTRKASTVLVTFAVDDDVVKHIVSRESKTHGWYFR